MRQTSSSAFSTTTTATLTIGDVSAAFSVTTQAAPPDSMPDPFSFTDQFNVALSTLITSNTITVSGINAAAPISVIGGEYHVGAGAWTTVAGTITNGQTFRVRHTSSVSFSTATHTTLTIDGISDTFTSTTVTGFASSDLAGTWRVYSLDASGIEGEVGGWSKGMLTINTTGTVTGGSLTDASGKVTTISSGVLSTTADGLVIGDLNGTPGPDLIEMNATMLSDKDVMIGVATNQWIDGAKTGVDFSTSWAVKDTATAFSQADLAGDWQLYGLATPGVGGGEGTRAYGMLTIDNIGTVSGSITEPNETFTITGGSLALGSDGHVTGTVTSQSNTDTESHTTTVQATILQDKDTLVGVGTTDWVEGAASGKDFSLFVLSRQTEQTFAQSDVAGTWRVYDLSIESTEGNIGIWSMGTLTFDSNGMVIAGSVIDAAGNETTISGGPLTLSASGALTGTLTGSPGPDLAAVNATMAPSKDLIVGVTAVDWVEATQNGRDYGVFAFIKEGGSTSQPVDTTGPSLVITSHSDGQTVSTSTITLAGTATDSGHFDSGISSVTVNGVAANGGTASGTGTANWSRQVTLSQGSNSVTVAARDNSPNRNSAIKSITVNYKPLVTNQPPSVNAGPDQTITLPASATHIGSVTDDGLPSGGLTTTWTKVSGPGTVTFGNPSAVNTTASFSQSGTYVLRLTANDGELSVSDDVTITVNPAPLTLLTPNGGEDWVVRGRQTIQWNSSGITGRVKIEISRDGGSSWKHLFGKTRNDGSQRWKVKGPATNKALIRVCSLSSPSICDTSDASFTIR